jgi:hypothetical protein
VDTPGDSDGERPEPPEGLVPPGGPPPPPPTFGQPPNPYASQYASQAYPGPYGRPDSSKPSQAMAGWALGLSLVFCVPLLPLVGLVLGIVVLARSREGRDHGKGMAIAAIVVGALVMVFQFLSFALGVVDGIRDGFDSTTRDDSGEVVDGGDMLPTKLRVGDCFDDPALWNAGNEQIEAEVIQGVPCSKPHNFEVYAIFEMEGSDDEYPGQPAIDKRAVDCFREFRKFVGVPYAKSDLEVSLYFPTSASWRVVGDRAITCVAWDPRDKRLVGSLKNAKR